mgnify:CR=1 FL=1
MSVWGKIIGGAAGFFALGGPLGALLGALAGHAIDKQLEEEEVPAAHDDRRATREIAFTIAVIALGAKMAKADGTVTKGERKKLHRMQNKASQDIHRQKHDAQTAK